MDAAAEAAGMKAMLAASNSALRQLFRLADGKRD